MKHKTNQDFSDLQKHIARYTDARAKKLVYHLYEKYNYSYEDVANILSVSRQFIHQIYPKKEHHESA